MHKEYENFRNLSRGLEMKTIELILEVSSNIRRSEYVINALKSCIVLEDVKVDDISNSTIELFIRKDIMFIRDYFYRQSENDKIKLLSKIPDPDLIFDKSIIDISGINLVLRKKLYLHPANLIHESTINSYSKADLNRLMKCIELISNDDDLKFIFKNLKLPHRIYILNKCTTRLIVERIKLYNESKIDSDEIFKFYNSLEQLNIGNSKYMREIKNALINYLPDRLIVELML